MRPEPETSAWAAVAELSGRFPDVPEEAIVKEDLLRRGMAWSSSALDVAAGFKLKAYFIFSFDMVPIAQLEQNENTKAPEEIRLRGGPRGFKPVVVSVRLNPVSPYRVELRGQGLALECDGEWVADVELQPSPEYYKHRLRSGKPINDIAPTIEWGYLLYLTVFRLCQYFGAGDECQFCDINENYRQQKKAGRPYTAVKSVEEVVEALEIISTMDSESQAYTVTGGSVTGTLEGLPEVAFYSRYPEAIESRFPGRWISKIVVQALPEDELQRFRDAGVQIYHPNYEIWDERLFGLLCAGKARYIGRDEWIKRILGAARVFGPENVIPNFVAGIEMSRPHGFESVENAIESTTEGLDFFMSQGVSPRFTTWCPEPLSALGLGGNGPAPLEYHVRLLRAFRDTRAKYSLPPPRGYGEPGLGHAVFSVSAFMDVLPGSEPQ